ncbi:MAG: hypothetical protein IJ306_04400 [Oscillospiraceae bacterium]|nr:hypothetical protein [Oscillospiraceae bacterium]
MKKLIALILALIMLCGCSAEPQEVERELGGEVTRGTFEGGFYYDFMDDKVIGFEGEHPIGSTDVKKAIYRNRAFGITVDLGEDARFHDDESTESYWNTFSDGKFDPSGAEFYDLCSSGGEGFGSIDIRYENMPKFRGKVLSEKEYAEAALDEFEKYLEEEELLHYDRIIHYVVQEKEIDTVKIDGEVLYCLKYKVSLTELEGNYYIGIVLRRTGDWMTNIFVNYYYNPGMEYAAKCITFD